MPDSLLPWISSSTILPVIHLSCSLLSFPTSSPHSPRGSEDRALRPPRHLEMVSEDGKTSGGTKISFLDASSSCCCQWISELVNLLSYLLTLTYNHPIYLLTCSSCSPNNTIITMYLFVSLSHLPSFVSLFYPNLAAGCW